MNTTAYQQKIEHQQSKGFLPRTLDADVYQSLLLLEESLQALEAAGAAMDNETLDAVLARRYAYPEMIMENIIADTIESGNMARYPERWIDHTRDDISTRDHLVDARSPFNLWADRPFTVTVTKLPQYPLLGFRSVGAYATFMLLMRDRRYGDALTCLNSSKRMADGREQPLFMSLFQQQRSTADIELLRYLTYQAMTISYGNSPLGVDLRNTSDDRLVSMLEFPPALAAQVDKNWYGQLLMKVRRDIKPSKAF